MDIDDDYSVSVSRVHQSFTLELFRERYLIDLIPIPLCEIKAIVGIDWLSHKGEMIGCRHQLVWVRTPNGGELVIQCEGAQCRPALCSIARTRRYLQHGCSGFFVYVLDTNIERKRMIGYASIV